MAGQTRKHSLLESITNILIGFWINIIAQMLIFPQFGVHFTFEQNLKVGAFFTVVSLARSYSLRRFFNGIL